MQKLSKSNIHFLGFVLGLITCLPIFLLPYWPFVHLNYVDAWVNFPDYEAGVSTGVLPDYTFSLGIAAPVCVITTIFWVVVLNDGKPLTRREL